MTIRNSFIALFAIVVTGFACGCTETQLPAATGDAGIRGINGIAGFGEAAFLIEERSIGDVNFKESTSRSEWDDLSYTFNFELPQPGAAPERIASRSLDVVADTEYTFVLAGDVNAQEVLLWEYPERAWAGDETVFEAYVGHANPELGSVDVYIDAPGTDPVAGNAAGTLSFGEQIGPFERETGPYQVTMTAAGDPATILFRGEPANLGAAQSLIVAVFAADPGITGPAALRIYNQDGGSLEVADARFPATIQYLNASLDTGAIDVATNGDYTNLVLSNLPFGEFSPDIEVVANDASYDFAPTGTTTPVAETESNLPTGTRSLFVLFGDAGDEAVIQLASIRRGYSTVARLRYLNAVTNTTSIDIYLRPRGEGIEDALPNVFNASLGATSQTTVIASDYDVWVAPNGSKDALAGPVPISLETGDVVELVILDTVDPNTADVLVFSNASP